MPVQKVFPPAKSCPAITGDQQDAAPAILGIRRLAQRWFP
jgi:hypothetical protein